MRAAKVQASLRIRAVSPEPPLLAHTSSESRGPFRQKARSLALLNGWACAVKIRHDGMLEDKNSLDASQLIFIDNWTTLCIFNTVCLSLQYSPLSPHYQINLIPLDEPNHLHTAPQVRILQHLFTMCKCRVLSISQRCLAGSSFLESSKHVSVTNRSISRAI